MENLDAEEHGSGLAQLERQEKELVLPYFDAYTAWALGSSLMNKALSEGLRVTVDIRRPGLVLFRGVAPGCTPDQQSWVEKKSALTLRMEASSALVTARMGSKGVDPIAMGWLDPALYALAPGSFPVRVSGVGVVAAVTASGLISDEDHRFVTGGLEVFKVGLLATLGSEEQR